MFSSPTWPDHFDFYFLPFCHVVIYSLSVLLQWLICFSDTFLQSPVIILLLFLLQRAFTQRVDNTKYWNVLLWLRVLVTLMDRRYICNSTQSWDASPSHPVQPYSFLVCLHWTVVLYRGIQTGLFRSGSQSTVAV